MKIEIKQKIRNKQIEIKFIYEDIQKENKSVYNEKINTDVISVK